jgi:hypothetical protein
LIRKLRAKTAPLHRIYENQLVIKSTLILIVEQWIFGKRRNCFRARQFGDVGRQAGTAPAAGGFLRDGNGSGQRDAPARFGHAVGHAAGENGAAAGAGAHGCERLLGAGLAYRVVIVANHSVTNRKIQQHRHIMHTG